MGEEVEGKGEKHGGGVGDGGDGGRELWGGFY